MAACFLMPMGLWHRPVLAEAQPAPLHIHMISGSREYRSEESLLGWKAQLERRGVRVTISLGDDGGRGFPELHHLQQADLLVVFARRNRLPEDQLAQIRGWFEAGRPVIGIRTASHAFQNWLEFDRLILGGSYAGHGSMEPVRVRIEPKNADHPILAGVAPWPRQDKLYRNPANAPGTTTLLHARGAQLDEPIAWCHEYPVPVADRPAGADTTVAERRLGRSFYTSAGLPHDFADASFLRLLENAIAWTTGRELAGER